MNILPILALFFASPFWATHMFVSSPLDEGTKLEWVSPLPGSPTEEAQNFLKNLGNIKRFSETSKYQVSTKTFAGVKLGDKYVDANAVIENIDGLNGEPALVTVEVKVTNGNGILKQTIFLFIFVKEGNKWRLFEIEPILNPGGESHPIFKISESNQQQP